MEKTIYEINYNDWFKVRMTSEREPMEEIAFDKAAFEAVLTDIVMRARDGAETSHESEKLWIWLCTQIGLALQYSELAPDTDQHPLDIVIQVVSRFKKETN